MKGRYEKKSLIIIKVVIVINARRKQSLTKKRFVGQGLLRIALLQDLHLIPFSMSFLNRYDITKIGCKGT
ncbi:MAG: hypothetical protein LBG80_18930 [Bacteroidales bacterium]|jgi:hypothetical protein|nr:hypothetical protein [Bacteroidales bacterium]